MTQYIRAAVAYPAVSSTVAQVASPASTDLAKLHARICTKLGVPKGTTQYGTEKSIVVGSTTQAIQIPDSVYAAMVSAGVDFSDAQYNSSTAEGTYTTTSLVPTMYNPGLHRQICLAFGDSLTDSATGSTAYPDLGVTANQLWTMGFKPGMGTNTIINAAVQAPNYIYSQIWADPRSRLIFKFANGGWRCANQSGYTYTTGSPWLDNIQQAANMVIASGQQVCAYIFLGTNDIRYADQNGNAGLAAVPTGTPGYTFTGSPDYFTNALSPLIAALKTLYPSIKIIWQSPVARFTDNSVNGKFAEMAAYAIANKASLGIDVIADSRQLPQFDPRTPSVAGNLVYYQNDATHLTPTGYASMKLLRQGAYDKLLGFTPDPSIAGALV